uniref:Putative structural protein n=1 Tax=viral metagenome TaxID=1070528 RepID=A0A6M3J8Z1_9ZZZZ
MAMKAVITKLDDVPEALRGEYKEVVEDGDLKGKFLLQVEKVPGVDIELSRVTGLRTALESEREERKRSEKLAKAFEGLDPDDVRKSLARLEKLTKDGDPAERAKILAEAAVADAKKKYEADLRKAEDKATRSESAVRTLLVDAAATKAIAAAKGNVKLLLPHVRAQMRVVDVDPEKNGGVPYAAQVIDPASGAARVTTRGDSTAGMAVEELVQIMRESEDFGGAFAGPGATGSGASSDAGGSGGGGGGSRTIRRGDFDAINASIEDIAAGKIEVRS